jgi:ribonuclease HI
MSYDEVKIFTDGSCLGNPGAGGWASLTEFWKGGKLVNHVTSSGGQGRTTNNQMELMAAIMPLETLKGSKAKISLTTDSNYVKDGITTWIKSWKKNGWKTSGKKEVKNKELWIRLDSAVSGLRIDWKWVKGHSGHPQNELVDTMSRDEALKFSNKRKRDNELAESGTKRVKPAQVLTSVKSEYSFLVGLTEMQAGAVLEAMGLDFQVRGKYRNLEKGKEHVTLVIQNDVVKDVFK